MLRKLLLCAAVLSFGGCANVASLYGDISGATVSPQQAKAAVDSAEGLETIATGYMAFCAASPGSSSCVRSIRTKVRQAIGAEITARNAVIGLLQANSGGAIPVASFNTLKTAASTLQAIVTQYNIGSPVAAK